MTTNQRVRISFCLTLVCLAGAAFAAPVTDDGVTLKRVFKVGDTVQMKTTTIVVGQNITVEQTSKQVVNQLKQNGDVEISDTMLGGKYTINGQDNDIPAGAPTIVAVNKNCKILTFKPDNDDNPYLSAATIHLIALAETAVLPDKPVKPGDSWTTEVDNPQVAGKKVSIKTTFVGTDKADGKDVWKLKQTLSADTDKGKMTADATVTLDAATGQVVVVDADLKGVPVKIGDPVDWTIKQVPVKADEKKVAK